MVRMVAITASLAMSSQVGATAVRTRSAARANSRASRIPVANLIQICRPSISPAARLTENGSSLNDERDVARDLAELRFEWNGRLPPTHSRLTRSLLLAATDTVTAGM